MSKHLPLKIALSQIDPAAEGTIFRLTIPLVKQPDPDLNAFYPPTKWRKGFEFYKEKVDPNDIRKYPEILSPYGGKGDYLYVQEEWSTIGTMSMDYIHKAATPTGFFSDRNKAKEWQPAETMPKAATRIWAKNEFINVERHPDTGLWHWILIVQICPPPVHKLPERPEE